MDPKEAAADGLVREVLLRIEDKLYETGVLVAATGDSECEVSLAFEEVVIGEAMVFGLVVRVATGTAARTSRPSWRAFREYVMRGTPCSSPNFRRMSVRRCSIVRDRLCLSMGQ